MAEDARMSNLSVELKAAGETAKNICIEIMQHDDQPWTRPVFSAVQSLGRQLRRLQGFCELAALSASSTPAEDIYALENVQQWADIHVEALRAAKIAEWHCLRAEMIRDGLKHLTEPASRSMR